VSKVHGAENRDKVYTTGVVAIIFLAIGGVGLLMGITDILIIYPYSSFVSDLYNLAIFEIVCGIVFLVIGLIMVGKAKKLSKETLPSSTEQKIFCADCGNKIDTDASFCSKCGAKIG